MIHQVIMREHAIGIDLGTCYSCVAFAATHPIQVIQNGYGETTHASVVSFLEGGKVCVGNDAKKNLLVQPETTIYSIKRFIGRKIHTPEIASIKDLMPFRIEAGKNDSIVLPVFGHLYTPEEISAFILRQLLLYAENQLKQTIQKAVITVPAYFNDNQRQSTKNAGEIAGLEVIKIINEPTAAALAFGYGKGDRKKIMVYDLGGGTFDVSILEIGEDFFEVLSTAGDTFLGGDDFDNRIVKHFVNDFTKQSGVSLLNHLHSIQKLKVHAEQVKKLLSKQDSVEVHIPLLYTDNKGYGLDYRTTFSRLNLDNLIHDLLLKTFKICEQAMNEAKISIPEIDDILLVGGSTKMPLVREAVANYFKRQPRTDINPDEVVAIGAAILAENLVSASNKVSLLDVTSLPLRIETVGGFTEIIVESNSHLPLSKTRTFATVRDNQEAVKIRVLQGNAALAKDCELLAEFTFTGFRKVPRGEVKIQTKFEIDTDGIVHLTATELGTQRQVTTQIAFSSNLDRDSISKMKTLSIR